MKVKVIDSIKLLVELISPSRDEMSTGDVRWHVNTLREDNRQLQGELADARRRLLAHEDTVDELRANLGVPAGTSLREYAKLIDAPRLNALEEEYKALVATMSAVRRLTNAADNVGTVEQVSAVMEREILAQARERQLITDKLELSKSVRRYKSEYSDLLAKWTQLDERCAALTNEVAELHGSKLSMAVAFEALERDKLLADASANRANASAEEAAELAERWESKSKEWHDALEAERKTVASLLEDRRLLHEANKRILALTGASSHETPVMAVERILNRMADMASVERERR
mgnify:FL=1